MTRTDARTDQFWLKNKPNDHVYPLSSVIVSRQRRCLPPRAALAITDLSDGSDGSTQGDGLDLIEWLALMKVTLYLLLSDLQQSFSPH